ncbi:hypothetical protein K1719_038448 [Acacia pycnantha]|nr:hypothetical protein K1719_038448 [Acacia pycnantha]
MWLSRLSLPAGSLSLRFISLCLIFCGETAPHGFRQRTRESTPYSLIRDPDIVWTPGSTTRPTCSVEANRRSETTTRRHIPTAREMDEFFADAKEVQQRRFVEKYNFDPVNDKLLPGCYEWEKLEP